MLRNSYNHSFMKEILQAFKKLKIVVVGDIMLDHYIWGDASRISPEAPVPVVAVDHHTYTAGGAANVALNLVSLGCQVELCGMYGLDESGLRLSALMDEKGIKLDQNFSQPSIPTITKSRVIVRQQQLCRLDQESNPGTYQFTDNLIPIIEEKIKKADAIIFSDYAKGAVMPEIVAHLTSFAKKYDVFVAMDPKPRRSMHFRDVDLLTPNLKESLELADIKLEPHEDFPAEEVCAKIKEMYNPHNLVITMGAKGMLLCEDGDISMSIPTYAREVFDVSGAGDTVIATLTAALAAGASLRDAAHLANTAAGVVVGKLGTATATPEEILAYHKENVR